jgi:hypothetical protein
MISQFSADGRETRYDLRQMTRREDRDTDALECWHGPIQVYDGGCLLVSEGHGTVYLTRNEASLYNCLREEINACKASAERRAEAYRKAADGCDEVRGVRGC